MQTDEFYMRRALALAARGLGWTNPNPMVGAVVVREGEVLAEGWHVRCGQLHAERHALSRATADVRGATMYVTLEPCCHHGKQPPCTEAVIAAGIARVVVGAGDPNPLVAGGGVAQLRAAGIEVVEGVLAEECAALNQVFNHYITTKHPFVILKYAMSVDGKIAPEPGLRYQLTGAEARRRVHEDRHASAAIMVGIGTVLADDPSLTARREEESNNPVRVIVDSTARIPLEAQVVKTAREVPTIVACTQISAEKRAALEAAGVEILHLPTCTGHCVNLQALMHALGERGLDSVYVEGGPTLHASLLAAGTVNKVQAYVAPQLIGGSAPHVVANPAMAALAPFQLSKPQVTALGEDVLLEYDVLGRREA